MKILAAGSGACYAVPVARHTTIEYKKEVTMLEGVRPMYADLPTTERIPQPAGFWIRVVASLVDGLILLPITIGFIFAVFTVNIPLVLLFALPSLVYKPLMESRYGATWGKMICGLRVTGEQVGKLSLGAAYLRFVPFMASLVVWLVVYLLLYANGEFTTASNHLEISRALQEHPLRHLNQLTGMIILVDCGSVLLTEDKRALHDFLAKSFCVWKDSDVRQGDMG